MKLKMATSTEPTDKPIYEFCMAAQRLRRRRPKNTREALEMAVLLAILEDRPEEEARAWQQLQMRRQLSVVRGKRPDDINAGNIKTGPYK